MRPKLREVIEAKLKGEGITPEQPNEPDRGNVIDLMAALKASLGEDKAPPPAKKRPPQTRLREAAGADAGPLADLV